MARDIATIKQDIRASEEAIAAANMLLAAHEMSEEQHEKETRTHSVNLKRLKAEMSEAEWIRNIDSDREVEEDPDATSELLGIFNLEPMSPRNLLASRKKTTAVPIIYGSGKVATPEAKEAKRKKQIEAIERLAAEARQKERALKFRQSMLASLNSLPSTRRMLVR